MSESDNVFIITRVFEAPVEKVWQAWTDSEAFKKWWGPEHFSAPDANLDVRVGGQYHASMQGPDGNKIWSGGTYKTVVPMQKLVVSDHFADEQGNVLDPTQVGMSPDFPKESDITISFEDLGGKTKLTIAYAPQSDAAYAAMKKTGMETGWNQSLDKLSESLN
jgi:uncharacterized protein YndB with AHSA1/START domain